jgi:hypothetical protein
MSPWLESNKFEVGILAAVLAVGIAASVPFLLPSSTGSDASKPAIPQSQGSGPAMASASAVASLHSKGENDLHANKIVRLPDVVQPTASSSGNEAMVFVRIDPVAHPTWMAEASTGCLYDENPQTHVLTKLKGSKGGPVCDPRYIADPSS